MVIAHIIRIAPVGAPQYTIKRDLGLFPFDGGGWFAENV